MPTYTLRGVAVEFPHEAYAPQLQDMDKVIESLQEVSRCRTKAVNNPPPVMRTASQLALDLPRALVGAERAAGESDWHGEDSLPAVRVAGVAATAGWQLAGPRPVNE
eukprot:SAG11_NODE_25262_length_361_cov_0.973282_1_plen_107_part_00